MTRDVGDLRDIALDVTVPEQDHGLLRPEVMDAAAQAAQGAHQVVLAMHHPPVPIGHEVADAMLLMNAEALKELVVQLPHASLILTGHVHTALASQFAGVPLAGAPSAGPALRPDSAMRPITSSGSIPGIAVHEIDAT